MLRKSTLKNRYGRLPCAMRTASPLPLLERGVLLNVLPLLDGGCHQLRPRLFAANTHKFKRRAFVCRTKQAAWLRSPSPPCSPKTTSVTSSMLTSLPVWRLPILPSICTSTLLASLFQNLFQRKAGSKNNSKWFKRNHVVRFRKTTVFYLCKNSLSVENFF